MVASAAAFRAPHQILESVSEIDSEMSLDGESSNGQARRHDPALVPLAYSAN
ncbi:hypothetical protein SAMCCGM7_pA0067 (plasmid) [Sinorhizobium americanum CCGM7]|nr:hypothetical protein SAMCCGM7_pA0067 [Sinorhizobium americanum CCGM7]